MTDEQTPEETPEETAPKSDELGDAGQKAIKAERSRAAAAERELRAVQAQLQEAISRADQAETASTEAQKQNLRLNVAITKGLDASLLKRLQGDDEESLSADADELLRLFPPLAPAPTSSTPRPDPSQGSRTPAPTTPAAAFASAMGQYLTP